MPEIRDAVISRETKPVYFLDKDGEKKLLGTIMLDQVENENLSQQFFVASEDNPFRQQRNADKVYRLGRGSKHLSPVDPYEAVKPLLNVGPWEIKDVMAHRGGTEIVTTLVRKDIEWADPYKYDNIRWNAVDVHGDNFVSTISACVSVITNLKIGFYGATYIGGLYRGLCGNKAEAEILSLPRYSFRHAFWDVSKVEENLAQLGYEMSSLESLPTGPDVCTLHTLNIIKNTLSQYRDELQGFSPVSGRFNRLPSELIVFRDMPDWVLNNFIDELDALNNHYTDENKNVDALSILMAYSNAINYHQAVVKIDRGVWAAISATNSVISGLHSIGQYLNLFGDFFTNYVATHNVYSDLNPSGDVPKRKGYKTIEVKAEPKEKPVVVRDGIEYFEDGFIDPKSGDWYPNEGAAYPDYGHVDDTGIWHPFDKPAKHVPIVPETTDDIPENVLNTIVVAQKSGIVDMHKRKDVIAFAEGFDQAAAWWLVDNPKFFFAALTRATTKPEDIAVVESTEPALPVMPEKSFQVYPDGYDDTQNTEKLPDEISVEPMIEADDLGIDDWLSTK